ncbi:MAG: WS/DGAT/MGAT family O-acyltransferase [Acidobacteriota bacterium]
MADEGSRGESLSNVDSAWLRMEDPTNLMTITALLTFEQKVEFARLKAVIEDKLLLHDRFRQRVVESRIPFVKPRWEEDDHFALKAHLRRMALPYPGDQGTLQETVSELMSTPLDYSKPLWQFHLIENYGNGSALVARVHHCIGDGIALVKLMFTLVSEEPDRATGRRVEAAVPTPAVRTGRRPRGTLLDAGLDAVVNPSRVVELARNSASAVGELGKLLLLSSDPHTVFKGKLGVTKRAAWSEAIALSDVKACSKRLGATINDVLLTAVTGALRTYMLGRSKVEDGLAIRAVVPVNLRTEEELDQLGNRFGLVFLALPVGTEGPLDRLRALKEEMDALKESPQAIVAFGVLNAMGMASPEIEGIGVSIFARKATAVMTNVPGPQRQLYMAGVAIRDILFWVPQSGRLGLGVSILSYNGQVRLGIAADTGLVPDPAMIVTHFHDEFEELDRISREHGTGTG